MRRRWIVGLALLPVFLQLIFFIPLEASYTLHQGQKTNVFPLCRVLFWSQLYESTGAPPLLFTDAHLVFANPYTFGGEVAFDLFIYDYTMILGYSMIPWVIWLGLLTVYTDRRQPSFTPVVSGHLNE